MKFYFFVVIAGCLFLLRCKRSDYHEAPTIFRAAKVLVDSSTVMLQPDSQRAAYKTFSANANGLFCGYSESANKVRVYSLRDTRPVAEFELSRMGEKAPAHPLVFSIFLQSKDSIFVLSRNNITLYNFSGKILGDVAINESARSQYFEGNYLIDYEESNSFSYEPIAKRLFVPTINPAVGARDRKHFETGFVTDFQFEIRNSFHRLPVTWTPLYHDGYYGFMTSPQFSLVTVGGHRCLLYNFEIEPNVYLYDFTTGKTSIYGGKPSEKPSFRYVAEPLDDQFAIVDDNKILHLLQNVRYYRMIKFHGGYVRAYEEPVEYKRKPDGKFTGFQDKRKHLTVFNERFEVIDDIALNDRRYIVGRTFATDDGIYIPYSANRRVQFKFLRINNNR